MSLRDQRHDFMAVMDPCAVTKLTSSTEVVRTRGRRIIVLVITASSMRKQKQRVLFLNILPSVVDRTFLRKAITVLGTAPNT